MNFVSREIRIGDFGRIKKDFRSVESGITITAADSNPVAFRREKPECSVYSFRAWRFFPFVWKYLSKDSDHFVRYPFRIKGRIASSTQERIYQILLCQPDCRALQGL
jgi:hypothetical protein